MKDIPYEEVVRAGTLLFVALGAIPDLMLESLARGDEAAMRTIRVYATRVLDEKRKADNAPLN